MSMELVAALKSFPEDKPSVVQQKPMLIGRTVITTQLCLRHVRTGLCHRPRRRRPHRPRSDYGFCLVVSITQTLT